MQYLEASRLYRGFVSLLDKPVEHKGSYCLPIVELGGSKKKNRSFHVALATLRKNLTAVDQTVAREKLSEWMGQESYSCPHLYRVKPQGCEGYNIHLQTSVLFYQFLGLF